MKCLLFILAIIFSCGIFFAEIIKFNFFVFYCAAVFSLFLSFWFFRSKWLFCPAIAVSIFLLGVVWSIRQNIPSGDNISRFAYYVSKENCLLKGCVISDPQFGGESSSFLFEARAVQTKNKALKCQGIVLVTARSRIGFDYGDELVLLGRIYRPYGKSSYTGYLQKQGIRLLMSVPASGVTRLNRNSGFILKRFSFFIKVKIREKLYQNLSPLAAGIADAMLLGNKKNIPFSVYKSMMKAGTVHILVVSGFNVGIVAVLADMVLKVLRLKRRPRIILTIVVLLIYCFATGASNPVVRATAMATVFLAAVFIKREGDIYNSLGLAAVFILMFNPRQLFDIGFQLSFLSVLGIVFLYPLMKKWFRLDKISFRPMRIFIEGTLVSLAAWLSTSGLIFYNFRSISPVAVLSNIFIVPLASFITLSGFALAAFGFLNPYLARFFAPACELAVAVLLGLNAMFLQIPGAYMSFR
ncbi:MAG: ComEC/Rec2 family competence protein [Candidatus Omnitrophota bacterium]